MYENLQKLGDGLLEMWCGVHRFIIEATGGGCRAKWLDADAVVKLFIPDASHSSFDDEVRLWQQLRHPNVLKMYGACQAGPHLQFFVCEYASQGSLRDYANLFSEDDSFEATQPPKLWKYLYEAALGLEYLHERGIVHGDLRCSNILIGSDGIAKLSNFALSGSTTRPGQLSSDVFRGTMRWQAPEILRGEPPSYMSDVYSLGMCLIEWLGQEIPWGEEEDEWVRTFKLRWTPESGTNVSHEVNSDIGSGSDADSNSDSDSEFDIEFDYDFSSSDFDSNFASEPEYGFQYMVWCACCQDPHKRANLSSIVYKLARLAAKESFDDSQPELEPANTFDEYQSGRLTEAWVKLETNMENCDNVEHCRAFKELKIVRQRLRESTHRLTLFERFHTLLTEFYRTVTMSPEQARIMRLSSTRATNSSMYAFQWRLKSLLGLLGDSAGLSAETEARWQQQRSDQTSFFVSGLSDTFLLLSDLKSPEERSAFLTNLKIETKNPAGKYTSNQLEVMKHAYNEIASKLETEDLAELTPEWFIPWYELIIDEWNCLGEGGFGSVNRAKWLDSEVVVKRVILAGSHSESSTCTFDLSQSYSSFWDDPSASQAQVDTAKRAEARAIFRREVDIWFGFSHPHVVRLFGACHIGRPFFVCEYATNGTLVCYLRKHPEQLWSKLHEAALGVQYLHAREIVHGDLKGNNIVIGSDKKAKVTDFGLSSVASSEEQAHLISGAWHWLAPECLLDTNKRPTIAADVYSLGMCVIEALRVVEAAKLSQDSCHCLPWRVADRVVVKYHATHGTLPSRPTICEDGQWELIQRMCALDPAQRIKISTVVDELARLANNNRKNELEAMLPSNSVGWESLPEVIASVRSLLLQPHDSEAQRDQVFAQYISLWRKFEQLYGVIDGNQSDECRGALCALVVAAKDVTSKLRDSKDSLVALAGTMMQCYALDRALNKLCDRFFIVHEVRWKASVVDSD